MAAPKLSVTSVAILAILCLVAAVGASTYRTTITTTTVPDEERHQPCKSAKSCEEQINGHAFTNCEQFILGNGQGDQLKCCNELGKLDEDQCRCDALKKIVQKGVGMAGADAQNIKNWARNTVQYCRMAGCNLGRSLVLKDV